MSEEMEKIAGEFERLKSDLQTKIDEVDRKLVPLDEHITVKVAEDVKAIIWTWFGRIFSVVAILTLFSGFWGYSRFQDLYDQTKQELAASKQDVIDNATDEIVRSSKTKIEAEVKDELIRDITVTLIGSVSKELIEKTRDDVIRQSSDKISSSVEKKIVNEASDSLDKKIEELAKSYASSIYDLIKEEVAEQEKLREEEADSYSGHGYGYYGHYSSGTVWHRRYFRVVKRGNASVKGNEYPEVGDIIEVLPENTVTVRSRYIGFNLARMGWVNSKSLGTLTETQRVRVTEVEDIGFSKIWIAFETINKKR